MDIKIPEIPEQLKDTRVNRALIFEAVDTVQSNQRAGTASTKTRAEVSGGGKKPWRQKGTGRARVGSNRSPIWKGGGIVFGPTGEQSYKKKISKKKRKQAVLQMIKQRIAEEGLKVVDDIALTDSKTKAAAEFLNVAWEAGYKKVLVIADEDNKEKYRLFRNIKNVTFKMWSEVSIYNLIENDKVLFSQKAWESFLGAKGIK
jgi:large subunit ribosomal protein L4